MHVQLLSVIEQRDAAFVYPSFVGIEDFARRISGGRASCVEDSHSNYGFVFQFALAFLAQRVGTLRGWRKNRNDGADVLSIDLDYAYQAVVLPGTVADGLPQAHGARLLAPDLGGTKDNEREEMPGLHESRCRRSRNGFERR